MAAYVDDRSLVEYRGRDRVGKPNGDAGDVGPEDFFFRLGMCGER